MIVTPGLQLPLCDPGVVAASVQLAEELPAAGQTTTPAAVANAFPPPAPTVRLSVAGVVLDAFCTVVFVTVT